MAQPVKLKHSSSKQPGVPSSTDTIRSLLVGNRATTLMISEDLFLFTEPLRQLLYVDSCHIRRYQITVNKIRSEIQARWLQASTSMCQLEQSGRLRVQRNTTYHPNWNRVWTANDSSPMSRPSSTFFLDVSLVSPVEATYVQRASEDAFAALRSREQHKITKYSEVAREAGGVVPFVRAQLVRRQR